MTELFFRDSPDSLPRVGDAARAAAGLENWAERSAKIEDPDLARFTGRLPDDPAGRRLLEAIFANSPFLTHCALSDMGCLARILTRGPDAVLSEVMGRLKDELSLETEDALAR